MTYDEIKGIDVKKGLAIVANNKTVYLRLLKSFAGNAFGEKIVDAVKSGDLEQVRLNAHALKGVAGNMHMNELFELSRTIESAAKEGAQVSISDDSVVRMIDAYEQTLGSVNMILETPALLDSL